MNEDKVYIFADGKSDNFSADDLIRDLNQELFNLEYGDVIANDFQIWEYPSGKMYRVQSDRTLPNNLYWSTPNSVEGLVWEPQLVHIGENPEKVNAAYEQILRCKK